MTTTTISTPETVRKLFDLACPQCKSDEHLMVVITAWAELSPDGTEATGDHEWDDTSACTCSACDLSGNVKNFRIDQQEATPTNT